MGPRERPAGNPVTLLMSGFGYFVSEAEILPAPLIVWIMAMDQSSQLHDPVSEHAPPALSAGADEALREELAKWRERVPKLAAALRQRAEEAEALKQELERLRRSAGVGDASAGIRAREELITELETRIAELGERHKKAQGDLHAQQLEADELRTEVDAWKRKWQKVTRALDEQAEAVGRSDRRGRELEQENARLRQALGERSDTLDGLQRALDEAVEERDSLRQRNEQLFETTELANRQIGSLTDSLAELRANLKQHREREQSLEREQAALRAGLESRLADALAAQESAEAAVARLSEELHLISLAAAGMQRAAATASNEVAAARRSAAAAEQRTQELERGRGDLERALDEARREVARLTGVIEVAQRTTEEREQERRALSERLQAQEARTAHLEEQLAERSALVVSLEQDLADGAKQREALEQQRNELEAALMRAERNVKESADHVQALDDKLERQKELMESLEAELAEAQEAQARAAKSRPADDAEAEVDRLQEQVRKLEALLRERTEALNRLEWRRQIEQTPADADPAATEAAAGSDEKLVLVLNQQLADARARNDELLARLRELERATAQRQARPNGDDLTRIHGVGHKLAEQLNELGIYRYEQIAGLDEAELADENHVLHPHRGRILRDGWIEQAVKLISH